MMAQTGIDVIESISPPPTGNLDIGDALLQLPESIALIGGIEPVFFQDCTREQLEQRVEYLLKTTRGRRYVLANSDSCPPAVEEWKLQLVSELFKKLPLRRYAPKRKEDLPRTGRSSLYIHLS